MATPDTIAADRAWLSLLERLSHQSVTKHFDAYADIDWDSPELASTRRPPLGAPADDRSAQPPGTGRRPPPGPGSGCDLVAGKMKIGLQFESVLKRGLLEFASTLPTGHRSSATPTTRSSRRRSTP